MDIYTANLSTFHTGYECFYQFFSDSVSMKFHLLEWYKWQHYYRITDSLKLEKISEIIESNLSLITTLSTRPEYSYPLSYKIRQVSHPIVKQNIQKNCEGQQHLKKLQDFSGSNVAPEFNVKWLKESQGMKEILFKQTGCSS